MYTRKSRALCAAFIGLPLLGCGLEPTGEGGGEDAIPPAAPPVLGERLQALADAIADYARLLAGTVDLGVDESVELFRVAMAPIDAHRARFRRASKPEDDTPGAEELEPFADEEDGLDIDSPLPPVPDGA